MVEPVPTDTKPSNPVVVSGDVDAELAVQKDKLEKAQQAVKQAEEAKQKAQQELDAAIAEYPEILGELQHAEAGVEMANEALEPLRKKAAEARAQYNTLPSFEDVKAQIEAPLNKAKDAKKKGVDLFDLQEKYFTLRLKQLNGVALNKDEQSFLDTTLKEERIDGVTYGNGLKIPQALNGRTLADLEKESLADQQNYDKRFLYLETKKYYDSIHKKLLSYPAERKRFSDNWDAGIANEQKRVDRILDKLKTDPFYDWETHDPAGRSSGVFYADDPNKNKAKPPLSYGFKSPEREALVKKLEDEVAEAAKAIGADEKATELAKLRQRLDSTGKTIQQKQKVVTDALQHTFKMSAEWLPVKEHFDRLTARKEGKPFAWDLPPKAGERKPDYYSPSMPPLVIGDAKPVTQQELEDAQKKLVAAIEASQKADEELKAIEQWQEKKQKSVEQIGNEEQKLQADLAVLQEHAKSKRTQADEAKKGYELRINPQEEIKTLKGMIRNREHNLANDTRIYNRVVLNAKARIKILSGEALNADEKAELEIKNASGLSFYVIEDGALVQRSYLPPVRSIAEQREIHRRLKEVNPEEAQKGVNGEGLTGAALRELEGSERYLKTLKESLPQAEGIYKFKADAWNKSIAELQKQIASLEANPDQLKAKHQDYAKRVEVLEAAAKEAEAALKQQADKAAALALKKAEAAKEYDNISVVADAASRKSIVLQGEVTIAQSVLDFMKAARAGNEKEAEAARELFAAAGKKTKDFVESVSTRVPKLVGSGVAAVSSFATKAPDWLASLGTAPVDDGPTVTEQDIAKALNLLDAKRLQAGQAKLAKEQAEKDYKEAQDDESLLKLPDDLKKSMDSYKLAKENLVAYDDIMVSKQRISARIFDYEKIIKAEKANYEPKIAQLQEKLRIERLKYPNIGAFEKKYGMELNVAADGFSRIRASSDIGSGYRPLVVPTKGAIPDSEITNLEDYTRIKQLEVDLVEQQYKMKSAMDAYLPILEKDKADMKKIEAMPGREEYVAKEKFTKELLELTTKMLNENKDKIIELRSRYPEGVLPLDEFKDKATQAADMLACLEYEVQTLQANYDQMLAKKTRQDKIAAQPKPEKKPELVVAPPPKPVDVSPAVLPLVLPKLDAPVPPVDDYDLPFIEPDVEPVVPPVKVEPPVPPVKEEAPAPRIKVEPPVPPVKEEAPEPRVKVEPPVPPVKEEAPEPRVKVEPPVPPVKEEPAATPAKKERPVPPAKKEPPAPPVKPVIEEFGVKQLFSAPSVISAVIGGGIAMLVAPGIGAALIGTVGGFLVGNVANILFDLKDDKAALRSAALPTAASENDKKTAATLGIQAPNPLFASKRANDKTPNI